MGKLFGTDGVRGVANRELTCELAMKIGRAAAYVLTRHTDHRARIVIGRDTRLSGSMLETALCAGICSVGADAEVLGVVPTPAVAYLVRKYGADAGVVISASHNPMEFNGIKLFSSDGFKLPDSIEEEIESYILEKEVQLAGDEAIGTVSYRQDAARDYADFVVAQVDGDLKGLKIAVDCANGASCKTAKMIFDRLGAEVYYTGDSPDGVNINSGVGSTHLENVAELTRKYGCQIGIAFDGDADRCLAVDEQGREIDGDKLIAIFAMFLKSKGMLRGNTAVVTVMTNLGFMDYCAANGIKAVRTAVGDRYVLEEMRRSGYSIGGEQSGHIILLDHATTGDGELTAAMFLSLFKTSGRRASELAGEIKRYPQVLKNITASASQKDSYKNSAEIAGYISSRQDELGDSGRVLVRVSGTEPLIRVMVEGKDTGEIERMADEIASFIVERVGI